MIDMYEEEHGQNEDEKFPTSRRLQFFAKKSILMESLSIIALSTSSKNRYTG